MPVKNAHLRGDFRPDLVPKWAKIAAWTVPVLTLPSLTWRLVMSISALVNNDNPCMNRPLTPVAEWVYVMAILPTVQLGLALLTLGLIQRWGVILPRWMPVVGRRRVPISFGVAAAVAGAFAITAVTTWTQFIRDGAPANDLPQGCTQPGGDVLVLYLPMALWPPLLVILAWHYLRRRRAEGS